MMNALVFRVATCALLAATAQALPCSAPAQAVRRSRLVTPGSFADDSSRLSSIMSDTSRAYSLLRSAATMAPRLPGNPDALRMALIPPEQYVIRNSALPFSLNDGAMWAGRGGSYRIRAGFSVEVGPVRLVIAPEFLRTENRPFALLLPRSSPPMPPARNVLSSPWHTGPESIDLPLRFG